MTTSRYAVSAPKRETDEKSKNPEFCDVSDCTSYYPGHGKPGQRGRADVIINGVARCCYHYDRELYRMSKGRHSPIMHGAVDLTLDMVKAHWAQVDAQEAANTARRAKPVDFRHAPSKPYTEVDDDPAA